MLHKLLVLTIVIISTNEFDAFVQTVPVSLQRDQGRVKNDGRGCVLVRAETKTNDGDNENDNDNNETNETLDWLSRASELRREALELESQMRKQREEGKTPPRLNVNVPNVVRYKDVADTSWMVTFRFTKDPVDDANGDGDSNGNGTRQSPPQFFSGTVSIRLRADGYTDLLPTSSSSSSSSSSSGEVGGVVSENEGRSKVTFEKLWGWDQEESNEDGLNYLLFSADISLGGAGAGAGGGAGGTPGGDVERVYFNARIDTDREGYVKLSDGTITVKREVQRTSKGGKLLWGLFDGGGILAQFRYVGNFSCRPI